MVLFNLNLIPILKNLLLQLFLKIIKIKKEEYMTSMINRSHTYSS